MEVEHKVQFSIALKSGAVLYLTLGSDWSESFEAWLREVVEGKFGEHVSPFVFASGPSSCKIPYGSIEAYTKVTIANTGEVYMRTAAKAMEKMSTELDEGEEWKQSFFDLASG